MSQQSEGGAMAKASRKSKGGALCQTESEGASWSIWAISRRTQKSEEGTLVRTSQKSEGHVCQDESYD